MPESRDAKLLQVLLRQAREDPFVNLVLAERSLILSKAKAPQPDHDVHDGASTLVTGTSLSLTNRAHSATRYIYYNEGFSGI